MVFFKLLYSLIIFLFLSFNIIAQPTSKINYSVQEVPVFNINETGGRTILPMGYAKSKVENKEALRSFDKSRKIHQVDLIFTKYPFNKKDWLTHYDSLLNNRINELSNLAPEILHEDIKWNFILQTNCKNEVEAKKMFHGAVFWHHPIHKSDSVHLPQRSDFKKSLRDHDELNVFTIEQLISGRFPFADSVVLKVFERNNQWDQMLVVNDWTGSMYEYGSQVVLWHKQNLQMKKVKRLVFFNDGDRKKQKVIGRTGGIYFVKPDNISKVIEVMNKVMERGDGGDIPENDMEALIEGISKTKKFKDLILIADSKSPVKDIALLNQVKVPVKVILCGVRPGETVFPDYLEIAKRTGGSIHTIQEDIADLQEVKEGERIQVLKVDYILKNGRFIKAKKMDNGNDNIN